MNCADSHVPCDWLFAARATPSGARAPELIANWFKLCLYRAL